jgi:hypothetical protein
LSANQAEFALEDTSVSGDYAVQRWSHGAERVVITVRETASNAEAVAALAAIPHSLAGPGPQASLPAGVAANGFMYSGYGRSGRATLYFVIDSRIVNVSGPSEAIAVSFAREAAEHLR